MRRPLSWRLYHCEPVDGCTVEALFRDERDCFELERLRWSRCDYDKVPSGGKFECEVLTEKEIGSGFKSITRCTKEYLRWEDVADAGRWDF